MHRFIFLSIFHFIFIFIHAYYYAALSYAFIKCVPCYEEGDTLNGWSLDDLYIVSIKNPVTYNNIHSIPSVVGPSLVLSFTGELLHEKWKLFVFNKRQGPLYDGPFYDRTFSFNKKNVIIITEHLNGYISNLWN